MRKSENVKTRLTPEEYKLAKEKADSLGITVSELMRRLLNSSELAVSLTYVAKVNLKKFLEK